MTIPDDFPTFLPVSKFDVPPSPTIAHLDIEHTKRVDAEQWRRDSLNAQADMAAMEAERNRDRTKYFIAGFMVCLAMMATLFSSNITSLFG